jgi:hypothetical protein
MSEGEVTPDGLAKKWFLIAFIGALAYVGVVFYFVLTPDVGPSDSVPVVVLQ